MFDFAESRALVNLNTQYLLLITKKNAQGMAAVCGVREVTYVA